LGAGRALWREPFLGVKCARFGIGEALVFLGGRDYFYFD
jgi:hypothetical protein